MSHPTTTPQHAPQQPPLDAEQERLWAIAAHLSPLLLGPIGPLVVLLVLGQRSAWVRGEAREALNFSLTVTVAVLVSLALTIVLVGLLLLPLICVAALVLAVLAAVSASRGEPYRYPVNVRVVR